MAYTNHKGKAAPIYESLKVFQQRPQALVLSNPGFSNMKNDF